MCPLKKPLIFAHEVELIEIEYFISMLTYTGFGPKCVYQSRLLFWFNHAKQIVVTYNCNIHAFKIISMACTTTKYMIHSLHTYTKSLHMHRENSYLILWSTQPLNLPRFEISKCKHIQSSLSYQK